MGVVLKNLWAFWTKQALHSVREQEALPYQDDPEFLEWFGQSKVLTADGNPLVQYHTTAAFIDKFWPLSHFGTETAANRASRRSILAVSVNETPIKFYPVVLKITNPIEIPDQGNHTKNFYSSILAAYLTTEEHDYIFNHDYVFEPSFVPEDRDYFPEVVPSASIEIHKREFLEYLARYESQAAELDTEDMFSDMAYHPRNVWVQRLVKTLASKGYDGFRYTNIEEDAGSECWVNFHHEQVRCAKTGKPLPALIAAEKETNRKLTGEYDSHRYHTVVTQDKPYALRGQVLDNFEYALAKRAFPQDSKEENVLRI